MNDSFPATDYAPATETIIFDIAGNKYRLISAIDFEDRTIYIESVLTQAFSNRRMILK